MQALAVLSVFLIYDLFSLYLVNSSDMSLIVGKRCIQKCIHYLQCQPRSYNSSTQCQYVGIVVQAGCLCAEAVGAECCTDSFHFVCRDRNADSGSADQDSLITRSVLDRMAYFSGVNRIINCLVAVASEVLIFQTLLVQICFSLLHQLISAVVAS